MLIIVAFLCSCTLTHSQERIVRVDNALESPITYSCRDSIYANLQTKIVMLYGEAQVNYEGIELTADYIEMDLEKKTVLATYNLDKEGNKIGIPKFTEGAEELRAASLKYNFETEKAYIKELDTKQEENYLHMGIAKRQSNGDLHFLKGRFTTCDLEDPHYHFQLSKAVLVPEKRIATGPINLWVRGVPTPLGLPFSFIPTSEQKKTGIIFPQIVPFSNWGFGLQDLGYYFPIKKSDNIQTSFYGTLYSRGTFGVRNVTDYRKLYKYSGQFNLSFNRFRNPFPTNEILKKFTINWNHRQEAKANPYWKFNSQVNFISDNNSQTNLDIDNPDILNNSFNSDVNIVRTFPTLPFTLGLKTSLKQNSQSENIDLELPTFTFNVNRFFPFKSLRTNPVGGPKFYEKIGATYSVEAKNRVVFTDTLLSQTNFGAIQDQFKNGFFQRFMLTTAVPIFDSRATITPSINYQSRGNFQGTRKFYDSSTQSIRDSLLNDQFGIVHNLSAKVALTSQLYAYYQFVGKNKTKMRHVITPNVSLSYAPNLDVFTSQTIQISPFEDTVVAYQPYANSLYADGRDGEQLLLSYNLNNTFEIKRRSLTDTIEDFTKTRIIDALSFGGSYNFLKDSLQFSDLRTSFRSTPFPSLSLVASGNFNLYGWNKVNGEGTNAFALKENGTIGRFVNTQLTTTYTIASKKSKEKIAKNAEKIDQNWESDYNYYRMHPHEILDFSIPWKISLSHNWYTRINTDSTQFAQRSRNQTQTIAVNADANFTKRWKIGVTSNYDIVNQELGQTAITLDRNMHCWQLGFRWVAAGVNQNFSLRLNATSALFKDAKLQLRKPPEFL